MSVDHLALMRSRLAEQFKGLPNLDAFLHAFGDQLNDLEEFYTQLMTLRTLQAAEGTQLDKLGVVLGQGRNALDDSGYRTVLQARIAEYQSNGTIEDVIEVLLVLGGASSVLVVESFPARFQAYPLGLNSPVSNADIATAINQIKLAGVGADVFIPSPSLPQFTFDHAVDASHAGFDAGHLSGPII